MERASGDAALGRSESGRLPCWRQTPFALVAYVAGVIAAHEEDEDEGYEQPGDDTNDGDDGVRVHCTMRAEVCYRYRAATVGGGSCRYLYLQVGFSLLLF